MLERGGMGHVNDERPEPGGAIATAPGSAPGFDRVSGKGRTVGGRLSVGARVAMRVFSQQSKNGGALFEAMNDVLTCGGRYSLRQIAVQYGLQHTTLRSAVNRFRTLLGNAVLVEHLPEDWILHRDE